MYCAQVGQGTAIVTCHDLLAVRGALGEETECPLCHREIRSTLDRFRLEASAVAAPHPPHCATRSESSGKETVDRSSSDSARYQLPLPQQSVDRARASFQTSKASTRPRFRLRRFQPTDEEPRRISDFCPNEKSGTADRFRGQKLTPELRSLGEQLGVLERVVEVAGPANELLEALYSSAMVLLYPSRFEGFGWPNIKAQACGCPVICSNRKPMSGSAETPH